MASRPCIACASSCANIGEPYRAAAGCARPEPLTDAILKNGDRTSRNAASRPLPRRLRAGGACSQREFRRSRGLSPSRQ